MPSNASEAQKRTQFDASIHKKLGSSFTPRTIPEQQEDPTTPPPEIPTYMPYEDDVEPATGMPEHCRFPTLEGGLGTPPGTNKE